MTKGAWEILFLSLTPLLTSQKWNQKWRGTLLCQTPNRMPRDRQRTMSSYFAKAAANPEWGTEKHG